MQAAKKTVQCQKSGVAWEGGLGEGAAPPTGRDAERSGLMSGGH